MIGHINEILACFKFVCFMGNKIKHPFLLPSARGELASTLKRLYLNCASLCIKVRVRVRVWIGGVKTKIDLLLCAMF